ncbi:MAG: NRDE family protein [Rhodospirillales bacterium]
MCTVVVLYRPDHAWPVIVAANRDEMRDRPWDAPGRHWPDRDHVIAGRDRLAGGTWLGINDDGMLACVLNRMNTLGPDPEKRSRGELPLEALDHAEAHEAAHSMVAIDPDAYRPFNMIIADARGVFWLRSDGAHVSCHELGAGVSMVTAHDLNDTGGSTRIRRHLPRFRAAPAPDPDANNGAGDWFGWEALLADGKGAPEETMCIARDDGFGTVSSSLCALPSLEYPHRQPIWRFAPGPPSQNRYQPIDL